MPIMFAGLQLPECVDVLAVPIFFKPPFRDGARVGLNKQVSPFSLDISPGSSQRNSKNSAERPIPERQTFRLASFNNMMNKPPGIKHDKLDGKADGRQKNPIQPVAVI